MNEKQIKIIEEKLGIKLSNKQILKFQRWQELFIEYNLHTNLMSKNEVANLFEKHIYDSLSIVLWDEFKKTINGGKLLDIGTGGGFPSVILAIAFEGLNVIANDSRSRKTKFIEIIKDELSLQNLAIICSRAEDEPRKNVDIVTFRAVGKIKDILPLAKKHVKPGGYGIFYKAKDVETEIREALALDKNLKEPEIIPYSLPMDVKTVRNLVVFGL